MLSRRRFVGTGLAFATTAMSLTLSGCNVYDDLYNWIGVGIASLNSIVSILSTNGITVSPTIVNAILGALNAVRNAIEEYKATVPAPVGAIAKIETALRDAVDQFAAFLRSISFSTAGGLFTMIAALVQVVLSTIAGFQNRLPVVQQPLAKQLHTGLAQASQIMGVPVVAKHRTIRAYKKDWNATLDNGPSLDVLVPRSAYHKISLFERLP